MVLPSSCLGSVTGFSFDEKMLSGVLSNTMPTTLTVVPLAREAITTALSARPASAAPVSTLAIESADPFEFSSVTSRPLSVK